jgi:hypothetical protein
MVAGGEEGGGASDVRPGRRGSCNTGSVQQWSTTEFVIAILIASAISMGTFAHADRHGSSHATAWGVGAFLFAALVVPVYFVQYWVRKRSAA